MGVAIYYIPSVSTTGGGKRGCTPLYKSGNIYIYISFFIGGCKHHLGVKVI